MWLSFDGPIVTTPRQDGNPYLQLDLDVPGRQVRDVANIGVHGHPVTLLLESLWIRDVTITTGLVDTFSTPTLRQLLMAAKLKTLPPISHDFWFDQMLDAHDTFSRPSKTGALKVAILLEPDSQSEAD